MKKKNTLTTKDGAVTQKNVFNIDEGCPNCLKTKTSLGSDHCHFCGH